MFVPARGEARDANVRLARPRGLGAISAGLVCGVHVRHPKRVHRNRDHVRQARSLAIGQDTPVDLPRGGGGDNEHRLVQVESPVDRGNSATLPRCVGGAAFR